RYDQYRLSLGWGKLQACQRFQGRAPTTTRRRDRHIYGGAAAVLEQVTTTVPIVLAVAFDPINAGLGTSLAQPAGNVTGISIQQPELIGKRLELLREVVPQLRRLAIMANAGYAAPVLEAEKTKATAQGLGLEAARLEIWRSEDIAPAFEAIRGKADALYVVSDALI